MRWDDTKERAAELAAKWGFCVWGGDNGFPLSGGWKGVGYKVRKLYFHTIPSPWGGGFWHRAAVVDVATYS